MNNVKINKRLKALVLAGLIGTMPVINSNSFADEIEYTDEEPVIEEVQEESVEEVVEQPIKETTEEITEEVIEVVTPEEKEDYSGFNVDPSDKEREISQVQPENEGIFSEQDFIGGQEDEEETIEEPIEEPIVEEEPIVIESISEEPVRGFERVGETLECEPNEFVQDSFSINLNNGITGYDLIQNDVTYVRSISFDLEGSKLVGTIMFNGFPQEGNYDFNAATVRVTDNDNNECDYYVNYTVTVAKKVTTKAPVEKEFSVEEEGNKNFAYTIGETGSRLVEYKLNETASQYFSQFTVSEVDGKVTINLQVKELEEDVDTGVIELGYVVVTGPDGNNYKYPLTGTIKYTKAIEDPIEEPTVDPEEPQTKSPLKVTDLKNRVIGEPTGNGNNQRYTIDDKIYGIEQIGHLKDADQLENGTLCLISKGNDKTLAIVYNGVMYNYDATKENGKGDTDLSHTGSGLNGNGMVFGFMYIEDVKTDDPEVDPEEPEVDPEDPEVDPEDPEVDPEDPEVDPEDPEVDPEDPEVDPEDPEVDPEDPEVDPEDPEVDPEEPEVEPEEPEEEETLPKTADNSNTGRAIRDLTVFGISAALAYGVLTRKKEEEIEEEKGRAYRK